jgi:DNA-binding ferritin-like protein
MSFASTMRFLRTGYSGTPASVAGMVGGSTAPEFMCDAICTMRAAYLTYRNAHWMVRGADYYGQHLLFERLYNETKDNIDALAEQIVGTYGSDGIREDAQVIGERVVEFAAAGEPAGKALLAAKAVQQKLAQAYNTMRSTGTLTPGWDDVLTSIAGINDKHVYLLQQATWRSP